MKPKLIDCWFITSEFASVRAGSFRQERWCRIFLESGARARVFNLNEKGGARISIAQFNNIASMVATRESWVSTYKGPQAAFRQGFLAKILRWVKHLLLVDLYLPNVIELYFTLDHLLKSSSQKQIILMCSSPPFSTALVGALIKKKYRKKIILCIDMRDAWGFHNGLGGVSWVKKKIEKFVLKKPDYLSTVSHGLASDFSAAYGVNVEVMYNIATHYMDELPPKKIDLSLIDSRIDVSRLVIGYTGSTPDNYYDTQALIEAVKLIEERKPSLVSKFQIVFFGACEEVRKKAEAVGIPKSSIIFIPHLPHSQIKSVQMSVSALLFLAHHGPNNMGVVSTKIFEYLYLKKPIIPLDLWKNSDVDMLLREFCGQSINVHGAEDIFNIFVTLLTHGVNILPCARDIHRMRGLMDSYRKYALNILETAHTQD